MPSLCTLGTPTTDCLYVLIQLAVPCMHYSYWLYHVCIRISCCVFISKGLWSHLTICACLVPACNLGNWLFCRELKLTFRFLMNELVQVDGSLCALIKLPLSWIHAHNRVWQQITILSQYYITHLCEWNNCHNFSMGLNNNLTNLKQFFLLS